MPGAFVGMSGLASFQSVRKSLWAASARTLAASASAPREVLCWTGALSPLGLVRANASDSFVWYLVVALPLERATCDCDHGLFAIPLGMA